MSDRMVLQRVLVVGVDPHRESLDVIGICFPEEVVLDEAFDNTPVGGFSASNKGEPTISSTTVWTLGEILPPLIQRQLLWWLMASRWRTACGCGTGFMDLVLCCKAPAGPYTRRR